MIVITLGSGLTLLVLDFFISILPERKLLMFVFWGLLLMTPTLKSIRLSCLLSSHCLPLTPSKFVEMGQSRNPGESSLVISELCLPQIDGTLGQGEG